MNASSPSPMDRYLELLAAEALGDLNSEETKELADLAPHFPDVDRESFARIAAEVDLAYMGGDVEPLPPGLQQKILEAAPKHISGPTRGTDYPTVAQDDPSGLSVREWIAWFAAAACLLIAISVWVADNSIPAPRAASQQRARLLADASALIQADWQPGKHPFGTPVTGDVVWSNDLQKGFMRFRGMPVNDPKVSQYQLWIIDPSRDDEPIDGGVFDISSDGEVVVPIDAKLKVLSPKAFAITVEKPGGVVVSTQENLPLLAPVQGS